MTAGTTAVAGGGRGVHKATSSEGLLERREVPFGEGVPALCHNQLEMRAFQKPQNPLGVSLGNGTERDLRKDQHDNS